MKRVGVFVRQSAEETERIASEAGLDFVQLHGGQSAAFAGRFPAGKGDPRALAGEYSSVQALQQDIDAFADTCGMYLLDAGMAAAGSSTGRVLPIFRFRIRGFFPADSGRTTWQERFRPVLRTGSTSTPNWNPPGQKERELMKRPWRRFAHAQVARRTAAEARQTAEKVTGYEKRILRRFRRAFRARAAHAALMELEEAMKDILPSEAFRNGLDDLLKNYAGRETPLTFCPGLSAKLGFEVWLKREDLLHTGAHKINNTPGQALLARHMGKNLAHCGNRRRSARRGHGGRGGAPRHEVHGVHGRGRRERQSANVRRMRLLGADVVAVESGSRTLKDAINAALRAWISLQETTHYCFARRPGRIRSRISCGNFRASSAARPARRCWSARAAFPTTWWRPWAAVPTPSACSRPSCPTSR